LKLSTQHRAHPEPNKRQPASKNALGIYNTCNALNTVTGEMA